MAFASNQTSNYGLCQWESSDLVVHSDFNEDNQKIDSALHSLQTEVDSKASQSALDALETEVDSKASQSSLNSLSSTVSGKASSSTVSSLSSRVSSLESNKADLTALNQVSTASARVMAGTYRGNGKYGSSSPNSLDFSSSLGRAPLFVIVRQRESESDALVLVRGITSTMHNLSGSYSTSANLTVSWTGQKVSWYSTTLAPQMNESGVTYCYFAVG